MIHEIEGDLFNLIGKVDAICHGVNTKGVMGAGIARTFRELFPEMYEEYADRCASGRLVLGGIHAYDADGVVIYNLATQDLPGPVAQLHAVEETLFKMKRSCLKHGYLKVAMPQIGCGIGGLKWERVEPIVQTLFAESEVEMSVVTLPPKERRVKPDTMSLFDA